MEVESFCEEIDRDCLDISAKMATVFEWTYGLLGYRLVAPLDPNKFDNATYRIVEIGIRALIILGAIAAVFLTGHILIVTGVVLGAGSKLFKAAGLYFQKEHFTHVRGSAPEMTLNNGQATVMTWNIRGYGGGLHYDHGGVVHWRSRIDRIVESIRSAKPDVLFLQDVRDIALRETLIARLQDTYAHFYLHIGESDSMVITKCPIHHFSYTEFAHNDLTHKRGFQVVEIKASPTDQLPCARIIGTQLTPGKESEEMRLNQVAQIIRQLSKQTLSMATLFVGSLHIDRDADTELSKYLYHSYKEKGPTYSNQLVSQWAPIFAGVEQSSDFISFFKRNPALGVELPVVERGLKLLTSRLVEGFDPDYNTKTARSDHHAVVTTFAGLRPAIP